MAVQKIQKLVTQTLKLQNGGIKVDPAKVKLASEYIEEYWATLEKTNTKDNGSLIGLPNKYLVPASGGDEFSFEEQYYWDSYFTVMGLSRPEDQALVEGMLDNLIYQLDRFGVIPNASRMYFVGRSQPPLLTTYIFHVYDTYNKSEEWLKERIEKAKHEYQTVWMSSTHPHWRNVHNGLSRYYDVNVLHDLAEAESGWDMTTRFKRKCLDYLPIDLNCLLFKYEADFERAATILGATEEANAWKTAGETRRDAVSEVMWSDRNGFFYDYNYVTHRKNTVMSLAAYYALWSGLATEKQAKKLVQKIKQFEHEGGLSTTGKPVIDMSIFGSLRAQWSYPNGWAPLHYIATEGLERYGYNDTAERIAKKWINTNLNWFDKHGEFHEKYNVVDPKKKPVEGVYPSQSGFGWTNGVFMYLTSKYIDSDS